MAKDKDPLVEDDVEDEGEEEFPESPALVDHTVDASGLDVPGKDVDLSSVGVTFVRGPGGKLTQVPTE